MGAFHPLCLWWGPPDHSVVARLVQTQLVGTVRQSERLLGQVGTRDTESDGALVRRKETRRANWSEPGGGGEGGGMGRTDNSNHAPDMVTMTTAEPHPQPKFHRRDHKSWGHSGGMLLWLLGAAAIPPDGAEATQKNVGSASNLTLFVVAIVIFHLLACVSSQFD